jgi:hypothetical protein
MDWLLKFCKIILISLCAANIAHAKELSSIDADNRSIELNAKGFVTLVLYSSEDLQDRTRELGRWIDSLRGRTHFRLIVVVDLRDSLGGLVPGVVRDQMRSNLDTEAKRIKPFYNENKSPLDPRKDLCVIPDFSGDLCTELGWKEELEKIEAVLFDENGNEINRWNDPQDNKTMVSTIASALEKSLKPQSEPIPKPDQPAEAP